MWYISVVDIWYNTIKSESKMVGGNVGHDPSWLPIDLLGKFSCCRSRVQPKPHLGPGILHLPQVYSWWGVRYRWESQNDIQFSPRGEQMPEARVSSFLHGGSDMAPKLNLIFVSWWGLFECKPQRASTKDYKIWGCGSWY